MKEKKTLNSFDFWLWHISCIVAIGLAYYNLFFCSIPGLSAGTSKVILFVGMPVAVLVLGLFTRRKYATGFVALMNSVLPCTVFFFITHFSVHNKLMCVALAVAVALSVACFCLAVFRRVKNKAKLGKIIRNRFSFAMMSVRVISGVLGLVVLVASSVFLLTGIPLVSSNVKSLESANTQNSQEWTIKNQIETLKLLQKEEWEKLDVDERLEVLGVVRNIEINYLGIPHEVYLSADFIDDNLAGYYDSSEHRIVLNIEYLEECPPEEALDTVCHEMHHAYAHNQVALYEQIPEEYKNLLMFSSAEAYREEFNNYISSSEDVTEYMYQYIEIDAGRYAFAAVADYYSTIEEYLAAEENNNETEAA